VNLAAFLLGGTFGCAATQTVAASDTTAWAFLAQRSLSLGLEVLALNR